MNRVASQPGRKALARDRRRIPATGRARPADGRRHPRPDVKAAVAACLLLFPSERPRSTRRSPRTARSWRAGRSGRLPGPRRPVLAGDDLDPTFDGDGWLPPTCPTATRTGFSPSSRTVGRRRRQHDRRIPVPPSRRPGALNTTFNLDGVAAVPASRRPRVVSSPTARSSGPSSWSSADRDRDLDSTSVATASFRPRSLGRVSRTPTTWPWPQARSWRSAEPFDLVPIFGQHAFAQFLPDGTPTRRSTRTGISSRTSRSRRRQREAWSSGGRPDRGRRRGEPAGGDGYRPCSGTARTEHRTPISGSAPAAPGIVYTNPAAERNSTPCALADGGSWRPASPRTDSRSATPATRSIDAAPVAVDDAFVMPISPFNTIAATGVSANDTDADGDC